MVLYIGPSKRLNNYYAPSAYYIENGKGRVAGFNVTRRIDSSVFNLPSTQALQWYHVHYLSSHLRQSSGQTEKF
jgi:hypothetical protein